MKYINKNIEQLDSKIKAFFDLSMPRSAFKRVIPTKMMSALRNKFVEEVAQQQENRIVAQNDNTENQNANTQVIQVNIAPLREAGYCVCPEELAAVCEILIRQQNQLNSSTVDSEMNNLTEEQKLGGSETVEMDNNDHYDTASSKSSDDISDVFEQDKLSMVKKQKAYPAKIGCEISARNHSDKSEEAHQIRTKKRKYFTKYMSNEFSKDTEPVSMNDMDAKTQQLFKCQDYNELVAEITGMN